MHMKTMLPVLGVIILVLFWVACTNDNEVSIRKTTDGCDTTNMQYSLHIAPIMAVSCNNCHSPFSPSGGVNTSDYTSLLIIASNGKLKGSVNHNPGFSPMPPSSPKLDSCKLKRINAWVNQGFPNN